MGSDGQRLGEPFCFPATICEGDTFCPSACLSIQGHQVRGWGEVSNTVTAPRQADYCASLAPSPVVRYASPPLPAAIPLPQLPVPALECFCSILNRLIEQCSRERAACQSQLKTQKQKIKKAHGWTPALIKKKKKKVLESCVAEGARGGKKTPQMVNIYSPILFTEHTHANTNTHPNR